MIRTGHHLDFDPDRLAEAKRQGGLSVSVCLPARDEEATVGTIVDTVRRHLVEASGLVDELIVVDDHSTDATAEVAAAGGAKVVQAAEVLPDHGEGHGKGEALWKSLFVSTGDLVVWCDSDVHDFSERFVVGLLGPLLTDPSCLFTKGFYERPVGDGGEGGGRVTELTARPLLAALFPELAGVHQPLSGEYAGRRSVLEQLPFVEGYGVDVAMLIDVARTFGVGSIVQVDLGARRHRNRTLDELGPQATAVLLAALRRAVPGAPTGVDLERPGRPPVRVDVIERPPLTTVSSYRRPL